MTQLYWHDYETFGSDPAHDRPAQFAGIRTDQELNIIGEPLVIYCKPGNDRLPQPEACLITGITPKLADEKGLIEAEFIQQIHTELATPNTCGVGYNSIRFDDEVTRYTLYRNFFDPYAREWQNQNSRWDIIDLVRMCYALRPAGLNWPRHDDGRPDFRLEALSAANEIDHGAAHDALSDVYATIGLAQLIRQRQRKLYEFLFDLRRKHKVVPLLNTQTQKPVVHTSSMYPAATGCTTVVAPITSHPNNSNGVLVFDLRYSPQALLELDVEHIRQRVFTKTEELPDGVERIPVKTVHINKCPALAPISTLTADSMQRLELDMQQITTHQQQLRSAPEIAEKLEAAFSMHDFPQITDPEKNLYGGFFNDHDRNTIAEIRKLSPQQLAKRQFAFNDPRLPELFFRYRARNWPASLTADDQRAWEEYRRGLFLTSDADGETALSRYQARLNALLTEPERNSTEINILTALQEYADNLIETR